MKRTAKDEVLAKWPNAYVDKTTDTGNYYIGQHEKPWILSAYAPTARAAWQDAARRLKAPA